MSEEETNKRKLWEDNISNFFKDTSRECDLMVLKYLRTRWPHQATSFSELERDILVERRKLNA